MAVETTKAKSWVQKTPGVCGGRACIRRTRITIWGLVNSRRLGLTDEQILENIVGLTPEDLIAAWDYFREHLAEIDDDIRANEADEQFMARLYADEDFPLPAVEELRNLGHDVLTVQEAGRGGQGIDDTEVLADAIADRRAVLTHNHADFLRLHRLNQTHDGIISCTQDPADHVALANRVHTSIGQVTTLANQFLRVTRPNPSLKP